MFAIFSEKLNFSPLLSALYSLPVLLVIMTTFIANDIFDQEKDSHSNFNKPIAKGLLKKETAQKFALAFAVSSVAIELFLNGNVYMTIFLAALFGGLLYSPLSAKIPTAKGLATAALSLMPFVYASAIVDFSISYYVFLSIALFIFGREILLDSKHIEVDAAVGIQTIPAYIGLKTSRFLAWGLMIAGVIYFLLNATDAHAILLSLAGLLCLMLALLYDIRKKVNSGGLTILTMILTTLAIPFTI